MRSHNRIVAVVVLVAAVAALAARPVATQSGRIQRILRETPLIDGHNDVPENIAGRFKGHLDAIDFAAGTATLVPPMHTDIPRLRAGGVGGQFWSV